MTIIQRPLDTLRTGEFREFRDEFRDTNSGTGYSYHQDDAERVVERDGVLLYEGLKVLVEKTNAVTKAYTNGPQAVGGIISQDYVTDTTYYHYDAIGNVLLTSDSDGYVDETFVQDAYVNVIAGSAAGYHLTTKEYFPAFGLYYFNARWYDP